jgi:hypothetical protein
VVGVVREERGGSRSGERGGSRSGERGGSRSPAGERQTGMIRYHLLICAAA